jgi:Fe-S cluster biogenesis protein NfuA
MADLHDLLERLEELVVELEGLDEPVRAEVFELLDGIDVLHRMALTRLGDALDPATLDRLREADPAIAWLLDAYGVGIDELAAAEAALEPIRPYIHSHGGQVEVLDVTDGVVRLRMSGACSGCTASAVTLKEGIEDALRQGLPGFARLEAEEDEADAHPPPGPTLLQIQPRPH